MEIHYNLASEHIYEKVGSDVNLLYPNERFLKLSQIIMAIVTIVALFSSVTSPFIFSIIIHIDIMLLLMLLLHLIKIGRGWVNTMLTCIDTIFVIEEVVRRRKRQQEEVISPYEYQGSTRRRQVVEQSQQVAKQPKNDLESAPFMEIDINKLNSALKRGLKKY